MLSVTKAAASGLEAADAEAGRPRRAGDLDESGGAREADVWGWR